MKTDQTPRPPMRGVVFDFDGTLVDSNAIKQRAYFEATAALGDVGDIVTAVLASCAGDRRQLLAEIVRRARAAGCAGTIPVETLVAHYTRYCEERIAICPEIAGATATLRLLAARGLVLFVNSATPTEPLRVLIQRRGWTPHFRAILGSPASKADNLRAAAAAARLAPDELCMVGDGEDDRLAARELGCAFAGVVLAERRFQGDADLVLSNLSALPVFLAGGKTEAVLR